MKQKPIRIKRLVQFRQWSNKRYAAFNSLKRTIRICTLALAYSIISKPEHAKAEGGDTTSLKTLEMDDVVVQSTLLELKSAQTGRSIEIIQSAQIQSLPVTSIDELLRYVPGIDAQTRGAFGAQTDFSLRGSNFNQVLVLIDGQKINDPLTAHFNSNIPISPSEIERIEIIRGPASVEYGPDAIGGVINIITKTFSKNQQTGIHADAKLYGGQYNLINTNGGVYFGTEKYRLSGGGLINKSDGKPIALGLKAYFDIRDISLSGQYQISQKWSAAYRYANDYRDFNAKNFYTSYYSDSAIEKVKRDRHQFQLTHTTENYSTQILASYINTNDYYLYSATKKANDNTTKIFELQFNQHIGISPKIKSLAGISFQQRGITSNDRGNHTLKHLGVFYVLSITPIKSLILNGGIREDYDENYGAYFLPQVSVSYIISKPLVMRGAFGRSVRAADFTENYSSTNTPDTVSKKVPAVGNPDLVPEKSWNSELGFDYRISKDIIISVTGFNRQVENLIDYVKTPGSNIHIGTLKLYPTFNYWYAQNNSSATFNGIETRFSLSKEIGTNCNLKLISGYTYLNFNLDTLKSAKYAMLKPKHVVNMQVSVQYSRFHVSVTGLYKLRNEIKDDVLKATLKKSYQVWNTSLDVDVYKHMGFLSIAVYNLFDETYSDFLGAEMPGRWLAGGLKIRL